MSEPFREPPVIVGNPFAPTGRGTTAVLHSRALKAANVIHGICDIQSRDHAIAAGAALDQGLLACLVPRPGRFINIYHLNADEITPALHRINHQLPDAAYNIVYPFWELSHYPPEWLQSLSVFDEIWAPSHFVGAALAAGDTQRPVSWMPLPAEVRPASLIGREHFGIPAHAYVFLQFFDLRSFVGRKNPQALLQVFRKVLHARPFADFVVVVKLHGTGTSEEAARAKAEFADQIRNSEVADRFMLIDQVYSEDEIHNLVRESDCLVSLHRSEGFGLTLAEAMWLSKPVIATKYSGNLDFMTSDNSCLVDCNLIAVKAGEYPHAAGQVWADPDIEQAATFAGMMIDKPQYGRDLGARAAIDVRVHNSNLAVGLRMKHRLQEIASTLRFPVQQSILPSSIRTDPIVVYQMGKVGSATVQRSIIEGFTELGLKVPVYHIHNLNRLELFERGVIKRSRMGFRVMDTLEGIRLGLALKREMLENPDRRWNIVTLIRDPVQRNVSAFFQGLGQQVPDWKDLYRTGDLTLEELQWLFLKRFRDHDSPARWFDQQMKPVFGVDVYATPFPKSDGYKIYPPQRNSRVLLIRLEDLERVSDRAFADFLGLPQLKIVNTNTHEEKDYRDLYEEFVKMPLPRSYVRKMYRLRFSKHFYTPEELDVFAERWMYPNRRQLQPKPASWRSSAPLTLAGNSALPLANQQIPTGMPASSPVEVFPATEPGLPESPVRQASHARLPYTEALDQIERSIVTAGTLDVPALFRSIPLEVFAQLLLNVPPQYPRIRDFLPRMSEDKVQLDWTGASGPDLMRQSVAFVDLLEHSYRSLTGKNLEEATVLDYGCGWGRLLRLLYRYIPLDRLFGVDPWDEAINLCREAGIRAHLAVSEYLPSSLPFSRSFDLIFAYSVFTHLSETAARAALSTLRKHISDKGLLVITVRPKEYWRVHEPRGDAAPLMAAHDGGSYVFVPHNRPTIEGDITYGDASFSLNYFETHFPAWRLESTVDNFIDPLQVVFIARPV